MSRITHVTLLAVLSVCTVLLAVTWRPPHQSTCPTYTESTEVPIP